MTPLLKYIGLLNILFFGISTYVLASVSQKINLKKHTISHLAGDKKTGRLFNLSLFIFAIVQVMFAIVVSRKVNSDKGSIEIVLFITGGISLCLASIFTTIKHPLIHTVSTGVCAFLVSLGVILLSLQVFTTNAIIGTTTIIATFLIPLSYLLRNKLAGAYWEFILFTGVSIWNITLTIPLFL